MGIEQKLRLPRADEALPGRPLALRVPAAHFVNDRPLKGPFVVPLRLAIFGMGCFWGAERRFWQTPGVYTTAVGYAGGVTPNPTYEEVCSGGTGHSEVVLVVYDSTSVGYEDLLRVFWEAHDPTQGMRQGNDVGTQYRSVIYTYDDAQLAAARLSRDEVQNGLKLAGFGAITTEIDAAPRFYYAEHYHQQYLAKVPNGYCGLGGTGVCLPAQSASVAAS